MEDDNSVDLRRVLQVSLLFEFNLMTNSYITRRFSEGVAGRGRLGRIVETISGEPVAAGIRAPIGPSRPVNTDEQYGLAAGRPSVAGYSSPASSSVAFGFAVLNPFW